MQQVRRPIVCASFGESNPLSAIPGLTALKSSPGMPIVTGYGRELPDHLSHRRRASRDNDLQDRDTGKMCIDSHQCWINGGMIHLSDINILAIQEGL
jgi:hypothetical protein